MASKIESRSTVLHQEHAMPEKHHQVPHGMVGAAHLFQGTPSLPHECINIAHNP